MRIRVLLANVSLCVLTFQGFSRPLLAAPLAPSKGEKRLGTETTIDDLDGEKAPELLGPVKTNNLIELRPTHVPLTGEFHTENLLEVGYLWNQNTKISYVQYFNTALYNPETENNIFDNAGYTWQDGFIRLKLGNLWQSKDESASFSIQERLYLPVASTNDTYPSRVSQGMITILRNYFTFRKQFFSFLQADISIAPSFFIFRKSGFDAGDKNIANPFYETLINQSTDFKISKDLLFTIPISFKMTRFRDYNEEADQNASCGYNLSVLPELDWSLNDRHTVGAAFVTDNLVQTDGSDFNWIPALQNGVIQVLWNMKF